MVIRNLIQKVFYVDLPKPEIVKGKPQGLPRHTRQLGLKHQDNYISDPSDDGSYFSVACLEQE